MITRSRIMVLYYYYYWAALFWRWWKRKVTTQHNMNMRVGGGLLYWAKTWSTIWLATHPSPLVIGLRGLSGFRSLVPPAHRRITYLKVCGEAQRLSGNWEIIKGFIFRDGNSNITCIQKQVTETLLGSSLLEFKTIYSNQISFLA